MQLMTSMPLISEHKSTTISSYTQC